MDKTIKRILIVDDEPLNISILAGYLDKDYDIVISTSGEDALRIIHEETRPDLIFLDVIMPEMSGHQVCQELKSSPETEDIPIIFVSAMDEKEDAEFGLLFGATKYITKPIDPEEIKDILAEFESENQEEVTEELSGPNCNELLLSIKINNFESVDERKSVFNNSIQLLLNHQFQVHQFCIDTLLASFSPSITNQIYLDEYLTNIIGIHSEISKYHEGLSVEMAIHWGAIQTINLDFFNNSITGPDFEYTQKYLQMASLNQIIVTQEVQNKIQDPSLNRSFIKNEREGLQFYTLRT